MDVMSYFVCHPGYEGRVKQLIQEEPGDDRESQMIAQATIVSHPRADFETVACFARSQDMHEYLAGLDAAAEILAEQGGR